MGLERFVNKIFHAYSEQLNKCWVVRAKSIEDATGKVVSFCKPLFAKLEVENEGKDIDVDLKFKELTDDVTEI